MRIETTEVSKREAGIYLNTEVDLNNNGDVIVGDTIVPKKFVRLVTIRSDNGLPIISLEKGTAISSKLFERDEDKEKCVRIYQGPPYIDIFIPAKLVLKVMTQNSYEVTLDIVD